MAVSDTIEIPFNRQHLVFCLIFALPIFIGMGVWFALFPPKVSVPFPLEPSMVRALGAITVVFFGLCAVPLVRQLRSKGPGLVLTPEGFTDYSTNMPTGLVVSWSEVAVIKTDEVARQPFLSVFLHDPAAVIARHPSAFGRRLMTTGLNTSGTPIQIALGALYCTPASLQAAMQARLSAWHERN